MPSFFAWSSNLAHFELPHCYTNMVQGVSVHDSFLGCSRLMKWFKKVLRANVKRAVSYYGMLYGGKDTRATQWSQILLVYTLC